MRDIILSAYVLVQVAFLAYGTYLCWADGRAYGDWSAGLPFLITAGVMGPLFYVVRKFWSEMKALLCSLALSLLACGGRRSAGPNSVVTSTEATAPGLVAEQPALTAPTHYDITGHTDAGHLARLADSLGVPRLVAWAVAYQESRHMLDPRLRGHHCVGKPNCEIGRFQILPSTGRRVCPELDITLYDHNVKCGLFYLRQLYIDRGTWPLAVRAYQCPRCVKRTQYEQDVMATVGRFSLYLDERN